MTKHIFIVDCFARTERIESKLRDCVGSLKSKGADVLLVSNTPVGKETLSNVKYYLYDSENHLFDDDMPADDIKLFHHMNDLRVWEVVTGVQRHGLSVLRNLFKSLRLAKDYGYTHFHRVEVDDIMGERSIDMMLDVPRIVDSEGKKGLFFTNDNEKESNISFHYMYCEIDLFLGSVRNIDTQDDYRRYLREEMRTDIFKNVEEFVRHNINRSKSELILRDGLEMSTHFPDTTWNTEISQSNLDQRFRGCTSRIYRVIQDSKELLDRWMVVTYNYNDTRKNRRVEMLSTGKVVGVINHEVESTDSWCWNVVDRHIDAIRVFEGGQQLYLESVWDMHPEQLIEI